MNNVKFWRENGVLMTSIFEWKWLCFSFVDCFTEKSVKVFVDKKLQKFSFAANDKRCVFSYQSKCNFFNAWFSFTLQFAQKAMKYKTEYILKFNSIGINATEPDRNNKYSINCRHSVRCYTHLLPSNSGVIVVVVNFAATVTLFAFILRNQANLEPFVVSVKDITII